MIFIDGLLFIYIYKELFLSAIYGLIINKSFIIYIKNGLSFEEKKVYIFVEQSLNGISIRD